MCFPVTGIVIAALTVSLSNKSIDFKLEPPITHNFSCTSSTTNPEIVPTPGRIVPTTALVKVSILTILLEICTYMYPFA